ncbi:hypothetical protein BNJ_00357 [Kaumoebavirus]|uniref:hypothetical protein n=1 Tax=Kaumoebavirus TaxID=1859492 RepID=UPI0009C373A3|nr:hypothetical protein BNJ_00357 [Kaumoebavirus]ARA72177.1 hypothetical protein BNJ_00357 [Kaumoebavirus]
MIPTEDPDIIFFYSDTCPACVAFKPVWEDTEPVLLKKGYKIVRAATGKAEALFEKYKVEAVPTVIFLQKDAEGKVTKALVYEGARTKGDIVSFAETNLKK